MAKYAILEGAMPTNFYHTTTRGPLEKEYPYFLGSYAKKEVQGESCVNLNPFGATLPGRKYSNGTYAFGFNGMRKDDEVHGEGNSYDFGARMHDPRLGRFLSLDPLSGMFAWQSPYSYADNSPILFIDLAGAGAYNPVPESYMNAGNNIDMSNAPPSSPTNAAGHPRNGRWYFRKLLSEKPEMFSDANVTKIASGKAPKVDAQWTKFNKTHVGFGGNKLVHHHIDQGKIATAIPENVHKKYFSMLHNNTGGGRRNSGKISALKRLAGRLASGAGVIVGVLDFFSDDPHSTSQQLESGIMPKLGEIYFDSENGGYVQFTRIKQNFDSEGNLKSVSSTYDTFKGYFYDEDEGTYKGFDKTGTKYRKDTKDGSTTGDVG